MTHHSRDAADEPDAVLHLLLRDLHCRAVLLLQREWVRAALRHPGMELQAQGGSYSHGERMGRTSRRPSRGRVLNVTLISCTVILVSGFLSSILSMSSFNLSLTAGLRWKVSSQVVGKDKNMSAYVLTNKQNGPFTNFGRTIFHNKKTSDFWIFKAISRTNKKKKIKFKTLCSLMNIILVVFIKNQ